MDNDFSIEMLRAKQDQADEAERRRRIIAWLRAMKRTFKGIQGGSHRERIRNLEAAGRRQDDE